MSSPVAALMMRTCRSWTSIRTGVPGVFGAGADVVELAAVPEGDLPGGADPVGADAVVGAGGAVAGRGFGPGGVGGSRGRAAREGAVRAAGVVDGSERAGQGLQLGQGGGLAGLGAEPVLHRLLEPFDFALGLGVVRLAVLLGDAEAAQLVLPGRCGRPGRPTNRVVNTVPLSVNVEAGAPWAALRRGTRPGPPAR